MILVCSFLSFNVSIFIGLPKSIKPEVTVLPETLEINPNAKGFV